MSRRDALDPSRQRRNRQKAHRVLSGRLTDARRRILAEARSLPRTRRQRADLANNATYYDYEYDADVFAATVAGILAAAWPDPQPGVAWYWEDRIEQPYRQGTIAGANELQRDVLTAIAAGLLAMQAPDPTDVLRSADYQVALASQVADAARSVGRLRDATAARLETAVTSAVRAGATPTELATAIRKVMADADSSAQRTAVTEVNTAYNNAKMRAVQTGADAVGGKAAVFHISALIPTTRPHHAARHGNVYTLDAQLAWWEQGANRINCYCSVQAALIDNKGRPVNTRLQQQLHDERSTWRDE